MHWCVGGVHVTLPLLHSPLMLSPFCPAWCQVNELFIEAKARERLGEIIPVGIRPARRKQLEQEREDIIVRLASIKERREQRVFRARQQELQRRMWEDGKEPEHIDR